MNEKCREPLGSKEMTVAGSLLPAATFPEARNTHQIVAPRVQILLH